MKFLLSFCILLEFYLKEVQNPNFVIKLKLYELKNINDNSFGLDRLKSNNMKGSSSLDENLRKNGQSEDELSNDETKVSLKKKLNLFETNYEIKFANKVIK